MAALPPLHVPPFPPPVTHQNRLVSFLHKRKTRTKDNDTRGSVRDQHNPSQTPPHLATSRESTALSGAADAQIACPPTATLDQGSSNLLLQMEMRMRCKSVPRSAAISARTPSSCCSALQTPDTTQPHQPCPLTSEISRACLVGDLTASRPGFFAPLPSSESSASKDAIVRQPEASEAKHEGKSIARRDLYRFFLRHRGS